MALNPAGIDGWAQRIRLTYFQPKSKVEIFEKFFSQGVKIQWPKTLRKLMSGPKGFASTYFQPKSKVEIFEKKIFFLKVWKNNGLKPSGNSQLGPGDSFGPIFTQNQKLKVLKKNFFFSQGLKIQWPKTLQKLTAGRTRFAWTYIQPKSKVEILEKKIFFSRCENTMA